MPSRSGSKAEPTIIFASSSTCPRIRLAASSTSNNVKSDPPVILIKTARAPFRDTSSSNGLEIADSAASIARRSPVASPVPIMALPISSITVRTSLKSRLIKPGTTIKSVIPRTPLCKTSSAIANASDMVVCSVATRKRFWFGIVIIVSTHSDNLSTPASANFIRREPSN